LLSFAEAPENKTSQEEWAQSFKSQTLKQYVWKVRSKEETYESQTLGMQKRVKHHVVDVSPVVDYVAEGRFLLEEIQRLSI